MVGVRAFQSRWGDEHLEIGNMPNIQIFQYVGGALGALRARLKQSRKLNGRGGFKLDREKYQESNS